MKIQSFAIAASVAVLMFSSAAAADPAVGVWKTQPDRKNLTSLIQIRSCGAALCGKVLRAFDPAGREVVTRNIGREIFWGVEPLGDGIYGNGTAWVPLLNVTARASMRLSGNNLTVKGCKGVVCDSQVWSRP